MEGFLLLKFVFKTLRKKRNIVIVTDDHIKTRGNTERNIQNINGALSLLKKIQKEVE